jgi:hypothetical protein
MPLLCQLEQAERAQAGQRMIEGYVANRQKGSALLT